MRSALRSIAAQKLRPEPTPSRFLPPPQLLEKGVPKSQRGALVRVACQALPLVGRLDASPAVVAAMLGTLWPNKHMLPIVTAAREVFLCLPRATHPLLAGLGEPTEPCEETTEAGRALYWIGEAKTWLKTRGRDDPAACMQALQAFWACVPGRAGAEPCAAEDAAASLATCLLYERLLEPADDDWPAQLARIVLQHCLERGVVLPAERLVIEGALQAAPAECIQQLVGAGGRGWVDGCPRRALPSVGEGPRCWLRSTSSLPGREVPGGSSLMAPHVVTPPTLS